MLTEERVVSVATSADSAELTHPVPMRATVKNVAAITAAEDVAMLQTGAGREVMTAVNAGPAATSSLYAAESVTKDNLCLNKQIKF
jgi:hypothetical protein